MQNLKRSNCIVQHCTQYLHSAFKFYCTAPDKIFRWGSEHCDVSVRKHVGRPGIGIFLLFLFWTFWQPAQRIPNLSRKARSRLWVAVLIFWCWFVCISTTTTSKKVCTGMIDRLMKAQWGGELHLNILSNHNISTWSDRCMSICCGLENDEPGFNQGVELICCNVGCIQNPLRGHCQLINVIWSVIERLKNVFRMLEIESKNMSMKKYL